MYYLFVGKTCMNPRTPYPTQQAAVESARTRQALDAQTGWPARTYLIVVDEAVVEEVAP